MQVSVREVWKSFDQGRIEVLKGVSLEVNRGEVLALCGTSGCGKSTLLNVISGLEYPDRGLVMVAGQVVTGESVRLELLRRRIGYVFQFHHLMPDLTLEENCMVPVLAVRGDRKAGLDRLRSLAEETGVAHRLDRRVRELSGGERQRGALVRALMNHPDLLLCDEPTGALDASNREKVFALLLDLARGHGCTLLVATHDPDLACRCDRTVHMHDGAISPDSTPE